MRFLPNGLNIPDELLEERDKGNVVFLCGAGVSYPAGMPDFLGLARYVVKELGTPQDAPSRRMLSMWDDEKIPTRRRTSFARPDIQPASAGGIHGRVRLLTT